MLCGMRAFDFPHETVEIACPECGRYGRYSKTRFCQIVGPNTPLHKALEILTVDCPKERPSISNMKDCCRAGYPQLV